MASFIETFPSGRAVLPVIHVESSRQVVENVEIAQDEGADGVFLIDMHGKNPRKLKEFQQLASDAAPTWFIGVNYLNVPTVRVFSHLSHGVSGLWSDNAFIDETVEEQVQAEEIARAGKRSGWQGLYFGGVAFKYQPGVSNLERASKIATKFMDVVTTSGDKTGSPPDIEKIAVMRASIGRHPLGIASGISPENVHRFLPFASAFLVATSLLIPGTQNFDKFRVRDLVKAAKG